MGEEGFWVVEDNPCTHLSCLLTRSTFIPAPLFLRIESSSSLGLPKALTAF